VPTVQQSPDRRIAVEEHAPEMGGFHGRRAKPLEPARRQQEPGAGRPVIEPQRVHPPLVDQVMHRGPVVGIRTLGKRRRFVTHQSHVVEVAEQERRARVRALER
jgi:hypothetical protein